MPNDHAVNELHFALVIGISQYPGGFAQLNGPVNDARAFGAWLLDPAQGGLPRENVELILTPDNEIVTLDKAWPTKEPIDRKLWELVTKARGLQEKLPEEERAAAREKSRLYIFAAGHGIMPAGGRTALLDALAVPERRTNLELSKYQTHFEEDR
jgi:hypothetical protein